MKRTHKNLVLLMCFVLSLTLCYRLALEQTLKLKKQHKHLVSEATLLKSTPQHLVLLKQKEKYYDSLLTEFKWVGHSIQNSLFKVINSYADKNNLKVISFLKPHQIKVNNLVVKTYDFTVEGDFNTVNQLVYLLEQQTNFGEVISLIFEKKKNYKTDSYNLQTRVLLKRFG